MKKIILLSLIFILSNGYSQFNSGAPWMANNPDKSKKTVKELSSLFNEYWKDKDFSKKGSGYKPFKRWEYHWQNSVDYNGYILDQGVIWDAFREKQNRKLNRTSSPNIVSNWQPIGPTNNANFQSTRARGRVNIVCVDPNNPNIIYMGTPAGGIWKTTNSGSSWTPLSDELPQIGVSGIAIDPTNSNIIYISTGDTNAGDTYSVGVMKSIDGGLTWNTTGLTYSASGPLLGDIEINPADVNMLWVATSVGIYRTLNAGVSWSLVQSGDFNQGRIRMKPGTPSTVYAVSNNRFFRSTDSGATFTQISTGMPIASGRLLLEVTPADPQVVYVLSSRSTNAFQGVYKSVNGGTSFLRVTQTTAFDPFDGATQAWYDLAFTVSPTNASEIYIGCLNIWKSTDSGATGSKLNDWATWSSSFTHADIHYLRFFGSKLYCGSDGGTYISENNGLTFSDITTGAQIGQIYKLAVSKQTASKIVTGHQDNGGFAFNNGLWRSYHGGDGMDNAVDPTNSNMVYGFLYYGRSLFVSSNGGQSLSSIVAVPASEGVAGTADEGGNWVTPLKMNANGELFAGYSRLHRLVNGAWVQQSIGTIGTGDIDEIAIDPSNVNNMYVANGNELYKSTNKGINFTLVYTAPTTITSIAVNFSNSNTIYLTTANDVLKSTTGGTSFIAFSVGLPNITKHVIVHQGRNTKNPLYVGTSLGVYYIDDSLTQWQPFDTNLPNIHVRDLEINLEDNKILAATYGRGVWQSDIPIDIPPVDVKLVDILSPTTVSNDCNNIVAPNITVKNGGTSNITSITFSYSINSIPYTYIWTGTLTPNAFASITLPSVTLTKGAYNLVVNSTTLNDAFSDNNSGSKKFYINDVASVNVTNTFENATNELLKYDEGSTNSLWTRSIRTGTNITSGTNNVYTTSVSGNYPDKTKSYLVSGCYDLSYISGAILSFKMAFDLELNWDIVYVEYSTNGGQSWSVLGTQGPGWYNSNRTNALSGAADDCQNCPGAQWTGLSTALTTYSQSLTALNNPSSVIFRIVFQSDDAVNNEGVIIDDFLISGTLGSDNYLLDQLITVTPNPSNGIFNISIGGFTGKVNIKVVDINGRLIIENKDIDFNLEKSIDLGRFQSGMYILKIDGDNLNFSTKLIKN